MLSLEDKVVMALVSREGRHPVHLSQRLPRLLQLEKTAKLWLVVFPGIKHYVD